MVGICHAGIPRYIDDWQELKTQLHDRNIREQVLRNRRAPKVDKWIKGVDMTVHGHTCFDAPLKRENSYWIDTFDKSGRLTVLPLNSLSR